MALVRPIVMKQIVESLAGGDRGRSQQSQGEEAFEESPDQWPKPQDVAIQFHLMEPMKHRLVNDANKTISVARSRAPFRAQTDE